MLLLNLLQVYRKTGSVSTPVERVLFFDVNFDALPRVFGILKLSETVLPDVLRTLFVGSIKASG